MLKRERIHRTGSLTLAEARSDVFDYVERGKSNHRPELSTSPGEVHYALFLTSGTDRSGRHALFHGMVVMVAASTFGTTRDRVASALQHAREYLIEKQSPGGGFCFYRGYHLEEPNLADTWYGVAALTNLLGVELSQRKEHSDFVIARPVEPQPFLLYCRIRCLLALQTSDPAAADVAQAVESLRLNLPDPASPHQLGASLKRLHCVLWLRKHLGMDATTQCFAEEVLSLAHEDGGYGAPSNLLDTADAIALLRLCGTALPEATREFVSSMADPQFGFRLTVTSCSPNLETVHAGAVSCRRLDMVIPYGAAAVSFVLSCQTGSGGFARASDALPDLTLTYMALTTLIRDLIDPSISPEFPLRSGME